MGGGVTAGNAAVRTQDDLGPAVLFVQPKAAAHEQLPQVRPAVGHAVTARARERTSAAWRVTCHAFSCSIQAAIRASPADSFCGTQTSHRISPRLRWSRGPAPGRIAQEMGRGNDPLALDRDERRPLAHPGIDDRLARLALELAQTALTETETPGSTAPMGALTRS